VLRFFFGVVVAAELKSNLVILQQQFCPPMMILNVIEFDVFNQHRLVRVI
jgi:hypothetical protein